MSPEQLIRPEILRLAAYHVADARGMVKLDAMENPYRLPSEMAAELGALLAEAPINRYPDPQAETLRTVLRRAFAVPEGFEILLGNGSDELIQILALAVARPGAVLLSVEPSFVMYRLIAEFAGMRYVGVSLTPDFALDETALLAAITAHRPALIFLAIPTTPPATPSTPRRWNASSAPRRVSWWWTRPITPSPAGCPSSTPCLATTTCW